MSFLVGDRVTVTDRADLGCGTVLYCGPTDFASGTWIGVELDAARGLNDGTCRGVRYFAARAESGLFVRPQQLTLASESPAPQSPDTKLARQLTTLRKTSPSEGRLSSIRAAFAAVQSHNFELAAEMSRLRALGRAALAASDDVADNAVLDTSSASQKATDFSGAHMHPPTSTSFAYVAPEDSKFDAEAAGNPSTATPKAIVAVSAAVTASSDAAPPSNNRAIAPLELDSSTAAKRSQDVVSSFADLAASMARLRAVEAALDESRKMRTDVSPAAAETATPTAHGLVVPVEAAPAVPRRTHFLPPTGVERGAKGPLGHLREAAATITVDSDEARSAEPAALPVRRPGSGDGGVQQGQQRSAERKDGDSQRRPTIRPLVSARSTELTPRADEKANNNDIFDDGRPLVAPAQGATAATAFLTSGGATAHLYSDSWPVAGIALPSPREAPVTGRETIGSPRNRNAAAYTTALASSSTLVRAEAPTEAHASTTSPAHVPLTSYHLSSRIASLEARILEVAAERDAARISAGEVEARMRTLEATLATMRATSNDTGTTANSKASRSSVASSSRIRSRAKDGAMLSPPMRDGTASGSDEVRESPSARVRALHAALVEARRNEAIARNSVDAERRAKVAAVEQLAAENAELRRQLAEARSATEDAEEYEDRRNRQPHDVYSTREQRAESEVNLHGSDVDSVAHSADHALQSAMRLTSKAESRSLDMPPLQYPIGKVAASASTLPPRHEAVSRLHQTPFADIAHNGASAVAATAPTASSMYWPPPYTRAALGLPLTSRSRGSSSAASVASSLHAMQSMQRVLVRSRSTAPVRAANHRRVSAALAATLLAGPAVAGRLRAARSALAAYTDHHVLAAIVSTGARSTGVFCGLYAVAESERDVEVLLAGIGWINDGAGQDSSALVHSAIAVRIFGGGPLLLTAAMTHTLLKWDTAAHSFASLGTLVAIDLSVDAVALDPTILSVANTTRRQTAPSAM